jgi:hypothetical protein
MGDSMSTIINATTTNGVVIQPDNSGSLVLQTNSGTTAVTVDTSQNATFAGKVTSAGDLILASNGTTTAITIDTSQRAAFVAGTAALPAITTTGDTNTGIWFPAADTIAFAEGGAESMRIDSSGNVGIGATTLTAKLHVVSDGATTIPMRNNNTETGSASSNSMAFQRSGVTVGLISVTGSNTTYGTSSDYRLKENIVPMTGALATVSALKPVTYKWKVDGSDGQGFIAHELQAVVPDAVVGEKDAVETYTDEDGIEQTRIKPQGIDTSFLVATLTAAIQEQQTIINDIKARVETLEGAKLG